MKWDSAAEILALMILGTICIFSMWELGVESKEITSSISGGIVGYLTRSGLDSWRNSKIDE